MPTDRAPRAPKPVRAWAVVWLRKSLFVSDDDYGAPYLWATKKRAQAAARRSKDHRVIRALITPVPEGKDG